MKISKTEMKYFNMLFITKESKTKMKTFNMLFITKESKIEITKAKEKPILENIKAKEKSTLGKYTKADTAYKL